MGACFRGDGERMDGGFPRLDRWTDTSEYNTHEAYYLTGFFLTGSSPGGKKKKKPFEGSHSCFSLVHHLPS